nr:MULTISPECIES: 2Fe-2S iron-sulfur cluster-binding protein [unclassified Polaribacter]
MKESFTEKSKSAILSKYGSVQNYYDLSLMKQVALIKKNSDGQSKKIRNAYSVSADTVDGGHYMVTFQCPDDQYLLDAAEENGHDWAFSDRVGMSSSCAAILVEGQINQSDQTFLTDEQMEDGFLLTCVVYPESDITILTHAEEDLY